MNDGMLLVNFGALTQAGADIQKAISRLESELNQLEQDAGPLVATWSGAARDAYAERQKRWQSASLDLPNNRRGRGSPETGFAPAVSAFSSALATRPRCVIGRVHRVAEMPVPVRGGFVGCAVIHPTWLFESRRPL
jgi:WXG100 family type VII secretion target